MAFHSCLKSGTRPTVKRGYMWWRLGDGESLHYYRRQWSLLLKTATGWRGANCDRATARLLLAGLLAEGAVREFVTWVSEQRLHDGRAGGDLDDVLTKLRELGVEVAR